MRKSFLMSPTAIIFLVCITSCDHQEPIIKINPIMPSDVMSDAVKVSGIDKISEVAALSKIASYSWNGRGLAPIGYVRGMALSYAKALCYPRELISSSSLGLPSKDALAYYGLSASSKNTYALLIGLGMRESSGRHCTGRDTTASNTTANSAEAGLFQTSYDSNSASPELSKLLKSDFKNCLIDIFSENIKCSKSDWGYFGNGDGYDFQVKAKTCPAFAVEYAAITLRIRRNHYGPINRKEVEFKKEAIELLSDVEKIVKDDPSICNVL